MLYIKRKSIMYTYYPTSPTDRSKPDSIRYHIIDIYFEELDKILELQREQGEEIHLDMEAIKRPLVVSSKDAINKVTRKKAKEALAVRKQQEEEEKEEDEDASEELEQAQVEEDKIASEDSEPEQDVEEEEEEEEVKPKKSSSSKKRKASTKKQSKKRKL